MEHEQPEPQQADHARRKRRKKKRTSWFAAIALSWATVMSGAIGYIAKTAFDAQTGVQRRGDELRDERNLSFEADQLSEFWWPLYLRLQVDSAVYRPIATTHRDPKLNDAMTSDLVDNLLLANHDEAVKIILSKFYLASVDASPELKAWFIEYIAHVAIYHAIRRTGAIDPDTQKLYTPEKLGRPFPGTPKKDNECPQAANCNLFVNAVAMKVTELQNKYDENKAVFFKHTSLKNKADNGVAKQ